MKLRLFTQEMSQADCVERIASAPLGRLGVIVEGRPEIFPVTHGFDRETGSIVFETNNRTKAHAALNWPSVAFEVDGLEPDHGHGWSVMVVGKAEAVTDAAEVDRIAALQPAVWSPEDTVVWVRIIPTRITGRRVADRRGLEASSRTDV